MNLPAEIAFDQELHQLEMRIARRADELTRLDSQFTDNLVAWERAEKEVWTACLREIEATLPEKRL
jgi:hypothetical protein